MESEGSKVVRARERGKDEGRKRTVALELRNLALCKLELPALLAEDVGAALRGDVGVHGVRRRGGGEVREGVAEGLHSTDGARR